MRKLKIKKKKEEKDRKCIAAVLYGLAYLSGVDPGGRGVSSLWPHLPYYVNPLFALHLTSPPSPPQAPQVKVTGLN